MTSHKKPQGFATLRSGENGRAGEIRSNRTTGAKRVGHVVNKGNTVSDTQKQNNRPAQSVGELRQKLAEADAARRGLLAQVLLGYSGEIGPLVALLVNEATPATVAKLEARLMEGGAKGP